MKMNFYKITGLVSLRLILDECLLLAKPIL